MAGQRPDPREELAQVARHTRAKVRDLNLLHGDRAPFDQTCRFTRDGFKFEWSTNGQLFLIEAKVSSAIVFSAGKPDRILWASKPLGRIANVNVFESDDFSPRQWLDDPAHAALLKSLELARGEQLVVARNAAWLTAGPRGFDEDWDKLGRLITLLRELPPDEPPRTEGALIDGLSFEVKNVPAALRSLTPILRTWSVSDDAERSERIEIARDKVLSDLWRAVEPQLEAIDNFIGAHKEPLPDEAQLLGSLAQAAHEAKLELERRSEKSRHETDPA